MTRQYSSISPYTSSRGERAGGRPERPADGHPGYANYAPEPDHGRRSRRSERSNDRDRYDGDDSDQYDDRYDADYDDYVGYHETVIDRRWMWVAGVAGAILLVAVICTAVILGGGDSGSVSATVSPQAPQTSRTAPPPAATAAPPATTLPPETMTTVTPTPSATASPELSPPPSETVAPPPPAAQQADPRTITYTVTGTKNLIDLVTIIYTDQQGALQTDVNVALPWSKTVVLDPGVQLKSVTATSVGGQLNCAITDASGAAIAVQANNSMIATCTQ
jgi:hypothetical protein